MQASEERLRVAQTYGGVGVWSWEAATGQLHVEPEMEALYGVAPGTFKNYDDWAALICAEDLARATAVRTRALEEGKPFNIEFRIRRADGEERWILSKGRGEYDAAGRLTAVLGVNIDVTERKRNEELLRAQARLLDLSNDAIVVRDMQNRITYWNRGAEEIYGYSAEQAIGRDMVELVKAQFAQPLEDILTELLRENRWAGEIVHIARNGRRVVVSSRWSLERDAQDRPSRVLETNNDITERKRSEQALRESEERFRAIADTAPVLIWVNDRDGAIFINKAYMEYLGLTDAKQAVGYEWKQYVHPDDRKDYVDSFEECLATRRTFVAEMRFRRHDGVYRWMRSVGIPRLTAAGELLGYMGCTFDIHEQRSAITALEASTRRFRLLAETAAELLSSETPDAMLKAIFTRIAPPLQLDAYLNYMLSGSQLQLVSYSGLPADYAEQLGALEPGQGISGTVAIQGKVAIIEDLQNSTNPMVNTVRPLGFRSYVCMPLLAEGRVIGTLAFASLARAHFDAEELDLLNTICRYTTAAYERIKLVEQLREEDRRKDEFLATLAHELRNPLAPIRNAVQILNMRGGKDALAVSVRGIIARQIDHMVRLVDDLLDVSRITRGKLELRRERIALSEVIERALETTRPQSGHAFSVDIPVRPVFLDADPVRMAQVFANLLHNACKFTPKGGRITLTATRSDTEVRISIRDEGIGIAAKDLPRVFEMFSQVDPALERAHSGLGIGLALSRVLVENHGGRIEAHSGGRNRGSEFTVYLPVAPDDVGTPAQEPPAADADSARMKLRVLVADDNRDSAETLATLLRLYGNAVDTAYDGDEAVQRASTRRPQIILLDIGMPKLNGYDACRAIRAQPWGRDVRIYALTGWGQEHDRRLSAAAGFDGHLVKPVDHAELMRLLQTDAGS